MGNLRKKTIGICRFNSRIDITDPAYDKDVWCRMDNVEIIPGDYTCVTWVCTEKNVRYVGNIGIYFGGIIPRQESMVQLGYIGVDSGLAGFFEDKPDYTDAEWDAFCERINSDRKNAAWIMGNGFFSESGYGDGAYPVYAHKNKDGKVTALEVRFI